MLVDGWTVGYTDFFSGSLDLTGARGICDGSLGENEKLTSVLIPNSIKRIADEAFAVCHGLTSVIISDGVTSIGEKAFYKCSVLTSVTIPNSVTNIAENAFNGCDLLWTSWYRTLQNLSATNGGSDSVSDARYSLAGVPSDRAIASVTVNGDTVLDKFVLVNGKVYDSVVRIENNASKDVKVALPGGYVYETFKGAKPLTIPAGSRNILTITRTADKTFLVSRRELEKVQ